MNEFAKAQGNLAENRFNVVTQDMFDLGKTGTGATRFFLGAEPGASHFRKSIKQTNENIRVSRHN